MKKKKTYNTPKIEKIKLRPRDTVLTNCKMGVEYSWCRDYNPIDGYTRADSWGS